MTTFFWGGVTKKFLGHGDKHFMGSWGDKTYLGVCGKIFLRGGWLKF